MPPSPTNTRVATSTIRSGEALAVLRLVMHVDASVEDQVALLERLNGRIPEAGELASMARMLRKRCVRLPEVPRNAVDLCGTGGDRSGTFNISTTAAFVVAGAGVPVVKHGNRAVSSRCGSADCLKALGIAGPTDADAASRLLREVGVVFLPAPAFHPAMAAVMEARRRLSARGHKTVFNLLGPLVNPGFVRRQAMGVFRAELVEPMAHALKELGVERAMVFHGDGLDEMTLTGTTTFARLDCGEIKRGALEPESVGLRRCRAEELAGGDAAENARVTRGILAGEVADARRDIVLLNAAAAILASSDGELTLCAALEQARVSLRSGAALAKLHQLRRAGA